MGDTIKSNYIYTRKERRELGNQNPHCATSALAITVLRETNLQEQSSFPWPHISPLYECWGWCFQSNSPAGLWNTHVLWFISCQCRRVKMTMSLWKSDSEKRNSAFSAKAKRPLIHTIKQRAKERKKWHCSAQSLRASVNSNLGCCWWLAVCQTLTKFQNGNNQAVMSIVPMGYGHHC